MRAADPTIVSKGSQVHIDRAAGEVRAVGVTDATGYHVCGNEGADEAEVDECDEEGRATSRAEAQQRDDGPGAGQDGDNEQDEDEGGCELVVVVETVDEPCLR
jgi:hypothetical protein